MTPSRPDVWKDASGKEHPVRDLTDDHLRNILRQIYRRDLAVDRQRLRNLAESVDQKADVAAGSLYDDPAGLAYHERADELRDMAEAPDLDLINHLFPILRHLEFEARRRGIHG